MREVGRASCCNSGTKQDSMRCFVKIFEVEGAIFEVGARKTGRGGPGGRRQPHRRGRRPPSPPQIGCAGRPDN